MSRYEPQTVIDPFSLLLISHRGKLKRVYCPFKVRCSTPFGDLIMDKVYVVEMVKKDFERLIIYIISGRPYLHNYFEVVL